MTSTPSRNQHIVLLVCLAALATLTSCEDRQEKWFTIDASRFPYKDLLQPRGVNDVAQDDSWQDLGRLRSPPPPPPPPPPSPVRREWISIGVHSKYNAPSIVKDRETAGAVVLPAVLEPSEGAADRAAAGPPILSTTIQPSESAADVGLDGTELSCTIILYGTPDYRVTDGESNCIRAARRARSVCGGKSLNFVFTHFVQGTSTLSAPLGYCYKLGLETSDPNLCTAADQTLIDEFQASMQACFEEAKKLDFTIIKLTPHVDDGTGKGGWRNAYFLDPFAKANKFSYADIMITPLTNALATILDASMEVHFSLQGEMNLPVVAFPKQWLQLAKKVKATIAQRHDELAKHVKVGISLNFNKLCGQYDCGAKPQYGGKPLSVKNFRTLLFNLDFLGMSAYPPLPENFKPEDLESSTRQMAQELQGSFQIDLKQLIATPGFKFYWSEFGIGGGTCGGGNCKANDVSSASYQPWYGIFGAYKRANDPWQNQQLRQFRKKLYAGVIRWLKGKGGPMYRVDGVYQWNMASWDVAGMYHDSTSAEGSYYDAEVMACVKKWNDNRTIAC